MIKKLIEIFMGLLVAIVAIIIILLFWKTNTNDDSKSISNYTRPVMQPGLSQIEVSVPNPETANPKDVVRFIMNRDSDAVRQVYNQLIQKGFIIPEKLAQLFRDKINGRFLMYSTIYWQFDIKDYQTEKENLSQYSKQYYFEIKGLHVKSYQDRLRDCVVFDKVILKKEPRNKYDPNAIKVMADSGMIGHVPANETYEVSEIMKGDYKAFIYSVHDFDDIESDVIVYYN